MYNISTKNLFLVQLKQIVNIKLDSHNEVSYSFSKSSKYIFAKKKKNNYMDVLTGTNYNYLSIFNKQDDFIIVATYPMDIKKREITNEYLIELLNKYNKPVEEQHKIKKKSIFGLFNK